MRKLNNICSAMLAALFATTMMVVSPELKAEQPLLPENITHEQEYHENGFYATGSLQRIINVCGSGIRESEGSLVLEGTSRYHGEYAFDIAVGHEFLLDNCDDKDAEKPGEKLVKREVSKPKHLRLELELFDGCVRRKSIDIGDIHASMNDCIDVQALFVNALYRVASSEHTRLWLGAGAGYAHTRYADASYLASCDCFSAATSDGLAFRLKMQAERTISKSSALFAELGYMHLPATKTAALLSTDYGSLSLTTVGVGLRTRF
jgi:hypothetical protein